jgi:uncharacterized membrane protein YfcA
VLWLAPAFFVTALLYASVGFGGGSTYSALLALAGVDYRILPIVSLTCNILVVTGGTIRFARAAIMPWRGAGVLVIVAAPAAFLGGLTPIGHAAFLLLLGAALVLAGILLLVPVKEEHGFKSPSRAAGFVPFCAAPLGYLAGLVGIGGGIFLAPLLHLTRWHSGRAIAATASLFILVNSLFGLAGQLAKSGVETLAEASSLGWALMAAVVFGGQLGTLLALRVLPLHHLRWLTALLTIWVGAKLLWDNLPPALA